MNIKLFVILQCIFLCCSGSSLEVSGCGRKNTQAIQKVIAGGEETSPGDYPWMVSLQSGNGHFCGGSVINERWILTAAHCVLITHKFKVGNTQAVVGLYELTQQRDSTVQTIKISKVVAHDNFNNFTYANDIALLKTDLPIDIKGSGGRVNGICLPKMDIEPEGEATVIGWGYESEHFRGYSYILKEAVISIVPWKSCSETYRKILKRDFLHPNAICTGMRNKSPCHADSGGPLFQTNSGVSTIIGIVSFGIGCGVQNIPSVYLKVSAFMPWIEKVIAEN